MNGGSSHEASRLYIPSYFSGLTWIHQTKIPQKSLGFADLLMIHQAETFMGTQRMTPEMVRLGLWPEMRVQKEEDLTKAVGKT